MIGSSTISFLVPRPVNALAVVDVDGLLLAPVGAVDGFVVDVVVLHRRAAIDINYPFLRQQQLGLRGFTGLLRL